jgi:hypothetical protein
MSLLTKISTIFLSRIAQSIAQMLVMPQNQQVKQLIPILLHCRSSKGNV